MNEKTSSVVAADSEAKAEASHPEYQTSAALSNQTPVQYPQSAAQSTTWRTRFTISPLPPGDETRFNLVSNGIRPIRSSPRETPVPARPSTSSGRPHRSVLNSRHISSFNDHVNDQRQSSRPNYCPRLAPDPLRDPEKAYNMRNRSPHDPHMTHAFADYIAEEEEDLEEHAVWILIYLSLFSPIVATAVSLYTILTTLLLLLLSPILCLCRPCEPWKQRVHDLLTTPICFQLRLVFPAPAAEYHRKGLHGCDGERTCNTFLLILLNIFFPIYAASIAVTSWVAAGFWITAIMLGNPDGRDGKDDGKAVVLGVRGLWERWLRRGLR